MKKTLSMLLTSLLLFGLLLMFAGCQSTTPTPSPSPVVSAPPKTTVAPAVSPTAGVNTSPSAQPETSPTAGTGAGTTIEGFEEGKKVDPKDAPEVEKAIKAKYPDAKVKSITYETHMDQQVYRVVLEKAENGGTDFYVSPDGTVTPYLADTSASPKQ